MPIEAVTEGQRILTHDGTFQPVSGRGSRRFRGELVRIVPRYFQEEPTRLTAEHPVLATTLVKGTGPNYWKWKWGAPRWVPAGELTRKDILLYPVVSETRDVRRFRISELLGLPRDASGRVHFWKETVTSRRLADDIPVDGDFLRLAGYFLADGCITPRGINFYFGAKEGAYVADVVEILERLFGYRPRVKVEGSIRRVECYAWILRDLFQKLFGKYSYGKSVPHWLLYLPKKKQAELVRGFWRGDGGTRPHGFVLVTNSPRLVAQLKMILLRLGIIPRVTRRTAARPNRTRNRLRGRAISFRHDRYELEIGGSWLGRASEVLGVRHPLLSRRARTHAYAWLRGGFAFLPIFDLGRERYSGMVHNLAVSGQNSYVTAGATVHNCDGFFFKGKDVVVVGGGDTAMEEASFLAGLCNVTLVHRRDAFRASKIMQERVLKNPRITVLWNTEVIDVLGDKKVEGVRLRDVKTGQVRDHACAGLFLAIGHKPSTDLFVGKLPLNEAGYLLLKHREHGSHTEIPGVFAAGDVHDWTYRQAVTAAGWGCVAAIDATRWLEAQGGETASSAGHG
jgi:intein/homing endonuclease